MNVSPGKHEGKNRHTQPGDLNQRRQNPGSPTAPAPAVNHRLKSNASERPGENGTPQKYQDSKAQRPQRVPASKQQPQEE